MRAPHKPLLLLFALANVLKGGGRWISYEDAAAQLSKLLVDFGPPRRHIHPEYPFWRLTRDGIWCVLADSSLPRSGAGDVSPTTLKRVHARGGFTEAVQTAIHKDSRLALFLIRMILDSHFPPSLHTSLLSSIGLDPESTTIDVRPRDPQFRDDVLRVYEFRCAVCGLHLRLGNSLVALDAAHIKWVQAGGPSEIRNGLALCALHHELFDRGAFTISVKQQILVSQLLHGNESFDLLLKPYHGVSIRLPDRQVYRPGEAFVRWHNIQVFKEPARCLSRGAVKLSHNASSSI
jgi:putative restriction endonuclease